MAPVSILETEFTGRRRELELIQNALLSSTEAVFCLYGIAGIGKTWLLRKAASHFNDMGITCAVCDFTSLGSLDYLHFLSVIRSQLDSAHFTPYDMAVAELQERLIELYRPLLRTEERISINIRDTIFESNVGDIVGVKYENLDISIPKSELERIHHEMQGKITGIFIECLRNSSIHTPTLVLIDGYEQVENPAERIRTPLAEWIEQHLLTKLQHNAQQILFVLARREPLTWARRNREWRSCMRLHQLDYFDLSDIEAYLGKRELIPSRQLIEHLQPFTRGHPQCIALVIDLLLELREQRAEDSIVSILDTFREEFDEKVVSEFLVDRILDLLPAQLSSIVTRLSIPHWFDAAIVRVLADLTPDESLNILERILRYSFVRTGRGSGYLYHDIVRDYLRTRFRHRDPVEYRRLHQTMHNYFSSVVDQDRPQDASRLREEALYHLFPVDETTAMMQFSDLFEEYDQRYQRDSSEHLLNLIAEHHFDLQSSYCWLNYYKARVVERRHQWVKVRDAYKQILDECGGDTLLKVRVLSSLGRAHWLLDEPTEAIAVYQHSAELYRDLGNLDEFGWNLRNIAKVYRKHGSLDDALDYCYQCREVFETSGDRYKIGWILKTLGEVHKQRAEYQAAREVLKESLQIWRELGFEYGTVDTLGVLADVQRFGGNLLEAKETYRQALRLYRKHSDDHGIGWSLHGLGEVLRMQGYFESSADLTKQSLDHFLTMNYTFGIAWNTRNLGEIARMVGSHDEAFGFYREAERLFDVCDDSQGKAWTTHSFGEAYLAIGRLDLAENCFNQAMHQLTAINDEYMLGRLFRNLADLERERGDLQAATRYTARALKIFRKHGNVYQCAICELNSARINIVAGRYDSARQALNAAIGVLRKEEEVYHTIQNLLLLDAVVETEDAKPYGDEAQNLAKAFGLEWLLDADNESYAQQVLKTMRPHNNRMVCPEAVNG